MKQELMDLTVRSEILLQKQEYDDCRELICGSMSVFPDSPVPHNLLGILLEQRQEHVQAMKHFRAAYALDPTYLPARYNMELYGSLNRHVKCAFREEDVQVEKDDRFEIQYDDRNIGRLVRKY